MTATKTKKPTKRKAKLPKPVAPPSIAAGKTVLCLRTCDAELKSYRGFQWRDSGVVEAPDWKPTHECGNGLHGLLWGEGDASLLNWDSSAKWLVVRVTESDLIDLVGKYKFPGGEVVHCGDRRSATDYLIANGAAGRKVIGGTATAGYGGTATAGDWGTATAGDGGTATAGYGGIIAIRYFDSDKQSFRVAFGEVGVNGIEPNVKYKVDGDKLVKA